MFDDDGNPVYTEEFVMPQENFSPVDYKNYGPNNEIYLTNGQAIAFKYTGGNGGMMHISAKAPMGEVKMKLTAAVVEDGSVIIDTENAKEFTINTATEMYYAVSDILTQNGYIIIQAIGDGTILSLCELKTIGAAADETNPSIMADRSALELALALTAGVKGMWTSMARSI